MIPFPLKPSRQVQKKLPMVSVQSAYISQLSVRRAHSSISARGSKYTNPRATVTLVAICTVNNQQNEPNSRDKLKLILVRLIHQLSPDDVLLEYKECRGFKLTAAVSSKSRSLKACNAHAVITSQSVHTGSIDITVVQVPVTLINVCKKKVYKLLQSFGYTYVSVKRPCYEPLQII